MTLIKIHNVETGEIIEREMTDDEIAQREKDEQEAKEKKQAETAKAAKKAEAEAKLTALGLDVEDLRALGL